MHSARREAEFLRLEKSITACRLCPRLVRWRENVAANPAPRFAGETYWGKPVPGFGDTKARLLVLGLAPAAHGANRTGRMFTGDRSGEWLYRALHKAGFANQPVSIRRNDGLKLKNCYVTASARCAPPENKPTRIEFGNCRQFLIKEYMYLRNVNVVLGLGKIAFDTAFDLVRKADQTSLTKRPKFSHGAEVRLNETLTLLGSYHPSQQNTFTGKLTEEMFDSIFKRAAKLAYE